MAGAKCPFCGKLTFFRNKKGGRTCSKCNGTMIIPANAGKGGKGNYCNNCHRYTVQRDNKCTNCGARYVPGKRNKR